MVKMAPGATGVPVQPDLGAIKSNSLVHLWFNI